MTATTLPQSLPSNTWSSLLKLASGVAVAVVLGAGSFAIGRGTADDSVTIVRHVVPVTSSPSATNDLPPVSLHTGARPAAIAPVAHDASCGRTAHTPPC